MFRRSEKTECGKVRGVLSSYIDGHLATSECEAVESHLDGCEACGRELESLRQTVDMLHRVPMVPPPRSFALKRVEPARLPRAFVALRTATVCCSLLLAVLFLGDVLNVVDGGLYDGGYALVQGVFYGTAGMYPESSDLIVEAQVGFSTLRQIEYGLLGLVVVLGVSTAFLGWRGRGRGLASRG